MPDHTISAPSLHRLTAGKTTVAVDASTGARIVSLALDGRELLTQPHIHPSNYGSTFWDAPQTAWNWPPRHTLDSAPYRTASDGEDLIFTSDVDPASGLTFSKRLHARADRERIEIVYTITNTNAKSAIDLAPWEVTRVHGGLSFFPVGDGEDCPTSALPIEIDSDRIGWYAFEDDATAVGRKHFNAGRDGWLAHVDPQGLLFVKQFADVRPGRPAPGHGEIEIWCQDGGIYIELENHGAYAPLAVGESRDYRVNWYLRHAPNGGRAACLAAVRDLIAENPLLG